MRKALWNGLAVCVAIVALMASPAALAAKRKTPTPSSSDSSTASKAEKTEKVNLNTADEKTIAGAKGVGDKLAQELVKNRPFKTWEDVSKVKGVGSGKKLESLKNVLKLSEGVGAAAAKDESAAAESSSKKTKKSKSSSKGKEATPAAAGAGAAAGGAAAGGAAGSSASTGKASASAEPSSPSKKSSSSSSSSSTKLAPGTKININTATKEELDALPEIGPVKAQAIVDYRSAHGVFAAPEDIMKVPGIKEGTYAKIKNYIVVR